MYLSQITMPSILWALNKLQLLLQIVRLLKLIFINMCYLGVPNWKKLEIRKGLRVWGCENPG